MQEEATADVLYPHPEEGGKHKQVVVMDPNVVPFGRQDSNYLLLKGLSPGDATEAVKNVTSVTP